MKSSNGRIVYVRERKVLKLMRQTRSNLPWPVQFWWCIWLPSLIAICAKIRPTEKKHCIFLFCTYWFQAPFLLLLVSLLTLKLTTLSCHIKSFVYRMGSKALPCCIFWSTWVAGGGETLAEATAAISIAIATILEKSGRFPKIFRRLHKLKMKLMQK